MKEVVCVKLDNDMDLILAHKRTMKLCELTGFSLIIQTCTATAISEIARCAIEYGQNAELILGIEQVASKKYLCAVIQNPSDFTGACAEATGYARRLVDNLQIVKEPRKNTQIILRQQLNFPGIFTDAKIESFITYFRNDPPLSPYDELRRKNILLQEFAEKIKESENHYRILTDALPLMMFSANNRSAITYTNKWLRDFLGINPKELAASFWRGVIEENDFGKFAKDMTSAIALQQPLNGEYRFKDKNTDKYVWHLFSIIPLKNEKDMISQWIGFIVDIDAQRKIGQTLKDNISLKNTQDQLIENQQELQRKIIELNRSNYELEQFAHLASHDLQEPLRKLFFYTDTLQRKYADVIDDSGKTMLTNMTNAAGRMKELIKDLLSYSQLHQQKLSFEPVDLNLLIQEVMKDHEIRIRERNASIRVEQLPVVDANLMRMRQLFTNLIENALKYARSGVTPEIRIYSSTDNGQVTIKVHDNGIGFDEQYREKIFGLFERLHTRDQIPGTGIGLSICRKIAEMHNGTIKAYSVPGEYAIFEVSLPHPLKQLAEG